MRTPRAWVSLPLLGLLGFREGPRIPALTYYSRLHPFFLTVTSEKVTRQEIACQAEPRVNPVDNATPIDHHTRLGYSAAEVGDLPVISGVAAVSHTHIARTLTHTNTFTYGNTAARNTQGCKKGSIPPREKKNTGQKESYAHMIDPKTRHRVVSSPAACREGLFGGGWGKKGPSSQLMRCDAVLENGLFLQEAHLRWLATACISAL